MASKPFSDEALFCLLFGRHVACHRPSKRHEFCCPAATLAHPSMRAWCFFSSRRLIVAVSFLLVSVDQDRRRTEPSRAEPRRSRGELEWIQRALKAQTRTRVKSPRRDSVVSAERPPQNSLERVCPRKNSAGAAMMWTRDSRLEAFEGFLKTLESSRA